CPRWHRTALGLGWAGNLILLGAVMALAVLVSQYPSQNPQTPGVPQSTERSHSRGAGCKLCPRHWVPHRDKCYWLSDGSKYWSRGRDDCSRKRSRLLVIQDWKEMAFIQNIRRDQNPVWIGLNITSPGSNWTWVDGSLLNQTLFTVSGPAEENSCAAIENNQIQSEICNTDFKWICQKADGHPSPSGTS
uniref:C-type lectin domain-containing protein n=1 Tax=Pelodiscus sinensis TaxID=13735 RepID=K7F399_PELSI